MVFTVTSRAALHDAERHWLAKFALRVITIVVALVAIIMISWASAQETEYSFLYLIVWEFIPLGISLLWNLANIIVLLARRRPMHPGANVGVDLIVWLVLIVTAIGALFAAVGQLQYAMWDNEYQDSPGYLTYANGTRVETWAKGACPGYKISCDELAVREARHHTLGAVELAASIFSFIVLLLHFILFVWACVDTNTRRRTHVNDRATKIAQTMIAEMTARGVLPAPQRPLDEALLHNDHLEAGNDVSNVPSRVSDARDGEAPWSQGNLGPPGNLGAPQIPLQAHDADVIAPAPAAKYT
ncbi:hypothetical protein MMC30_001282 [Trapelia coarctata]|nr:hypothetical protein [Trapelia coarctata]